MNNRHLPTGPQKPTPLCSILIVGDAFAPEILPFSRALYLPVQQFVGDGLYVLSINGTKIPKKVQRLADGTLRLLPGNPAYDAEELVPLPDAAGTYRVASTGGTAEVRIVGKIVSYFKPA